MTGQSCLYEGRVRHRRRQPMTHGFAYRLFMVYLDLDELGHVFAGRWFWSTRRPSLAWFRRADHLGDPAVSLSDSVRELVQQRLGFRPAGPIRLLTHLRYFGYAMNPVSFYYCHAADGESLAAIVAEVNNTPWGEQHCYVLDARAGGPVCRGHFAKAFHVSPFMDMDLDYDWTFTRPGADLHVHMINQRGGETLFDATLQLERRPISDWNLTRVLLRYPWMTLQVVAAIYWQAGRLWWKGCPFYPHPRYRTAQEESPHDACA